MSSPFACILGATGPVRRTEEAAKQPSDRSDDASAHAEPRKSNSEAPQSAEIVQFPTGSQQYLDPSVDLGSLPLPIVRFPGTKMVLPDLETTYPGWSAFVNEVAPDPASVIERKDRVPYYIAGTLKEAELVNKTLREQRLDNGQSTVGKQRSAAHIETLGPALFLDDDGDVFAREPFLRALGVAAAIYSSHSYGFPKEPGAPTALCGRIVLVLNRSVTTSEYGLVWDAVNHLSGGGLDEHGRSPSLCYGQHARRSDQAPYQRRIVDGTALDADALIELGRSLKPPSIRDWQSQKPENGHKRAQIEEVERARLMGAVRPPDDYGEWMSGAAAFKRAFADIEAAYQCFNAWSACSPKYPGIDQTRSKFDQVPADYLGSALPVTIEMLHWRARRRAEVIIHTLFSPAAQWQLASAFQGMATESLGAGISLPKGSEGIDPASLTPEDGIVALDYLGYCWSDKVLQQVVVGQNVPQAALEEARMRGDQRREKIDLAGRVLHEWGGRNLAADTAALADAIIASNPKLYRVGQALVRISAPVSDAATAERVRKTHGYKGRPGEPGDPVIHAGERLTPVLPSDSEALREIIAEHVAAMRWVNFGTNAKPDWRKEIRSFSFKTSARLQEEPDAGVLKDLLKRGLVEQVPEIRAIVTAPIMPDLPRSTNAEDLTKMGGDRILSEPGFDAETGLYLSPLGSICEVPGSPSQAQVKEATELLLMPWADFTFVSPGDGIDAQVSRSVAIYGSILAANRRALEIAPGIAFSSHGEGMSSGKTLATEIICIIATGELPAPISLSPDFSEQRKQIITHLIEGDGTLFVDNIPNGARFDSAVLAAVMTNPRFKDRLLGTNKQIEASTQVMVAANGNGLNLAGDLASRVLTSRMDTGLERPEDRSVAEFKIPDLRRWAVQHRRKLVAAIHTVVRGYLQECRCCGGTPAHIVGRRQVNGTRFGGPCEVLRDAFLWAFPGLPDPFVAFQASAANSSTKAEAELVVRLLDQVMAKAAGQQCGPAWVATPFSGTTSPERARWEQKFRARWSHMTDDQRQKRFHTADLPKAESQEWEHIRSVVQIRVGRREVRAGRKRLTAADIIKASSEDERSVLEGATHGRAATNTKGLNAVSFGRWLKDRIVDAPINGQVLRSAKDRTKTAYFWIEVL